MAAAALVEGGAVRLAVAGGGSAPVRMGAVERSLAGQRLTTDRLESVAALVEAAVSPQADFRGSAEYRRSMAGVLARRALAEAAGLAKRT